MWRTAARGHTHEEQDMTEMEDHHVTLVVRGRGSTWKSAPRLSGEHWTHHSCRLLYHRPPSATIKSMQPTATARHQRQRQSAMWRTAACAGRQWDACHDARGTDGCEAAIGTHVTGASNRRQRWGETRHSLGEGAQARRRRAETMGTAGLTGSRCTRSTSMQPTTTTHSARWPASCGTSAWATTA